MNKGDGTALAVAIFTIVLLCFTMLFFNCGTERRLCISSTGDSTECLKALQYEELPLCKHGDK